MSGPTLKMADEHAARLRGLDMGDDAFQLELMEQEVAEAVAEDGPTAADLLYLGVLLYRAKRWAEAADALEGAADDDQTQRAKGLLLAAYAHLQLGDGEAALRALDRLGPAPDGDGDGDDQVWRHHHTRGDVLFRLGRHADAERAYAAALRADQQSVTLVEIGLLRAARGDVAGAIESLETALKESYDPTAAYELAALRAARGEGAAVVALLTSHSDTDQQVARAASDPRFAAVAGDRAFAALVSPPDLSWLARFPTVAALAAEPALGALGVRFVGEQESRERSKAGEYQSFSLGVLWSDALLDDCAARAERAVLVAHGPKLPARMYSVDDQLELWVDAESPERLYLAASPSVPPAFWMPLPATLEAVRAAVAELHPPVRRARIELARVERAFMGYPNTIKVPNPYSGEIEDEAGFHEMGRHFVMSPFTDDFEWGTSHDDDPWPDVFPTQPAYMVKFTAQSREVRKHREGTVCRFTRRTRFSRSQISIEYHHRRLYVWEARFRPARQTDWVRAFNQRHGTSYPEDMPFDVIGTLFGFDAVTAGALERKLAEQTSSEQIAAYLDAITAIRHSDVTVTELVWRYMQSGDEQVRRAAAQHAATFNWEFLLEDMALVEPNPQLKGLIADVLDQGIAAPSHEDADE
jgi:tetratricopeptide (TPR) repeat protein